MHTGEHIIDNIMMYVHVFKIQIEGVGVYVSEIVLT